MLKIKIHITDSMLKKIKTVCNWLLKEVVAGVTVAAAIAVATLVVSEYTKYKQEQENLELLYLGLSRQYVESVFGIPVVEFTEAESNTIRAFYKQKYSVVSCSYADDHIVAFFVIVNADKKLYRIPYNFFIDDPAYLTDFTYADFSEKADDFEANCSANNDDYAYYTETYYGAAAAEYNYYIIGSYKNYFDNSYMPLISNALTAWNDENNFYKTDEYYSVRTKAEPNVFGMVDAQYVDSIWLSSISEELRTYNHSIFNNWWK